MIELEITPRRTWRQMFVDGLKAFLEGFGDAAGKLLLSILLLILVVLALPLIIYVSILLFAFTGESPMSEREPIEGDRSRESRRASQKHEFDVFLVGGPRDGQCLRNIDSAFIEFPSICASGGFEAMVYAKTRVIYEYQTAGSVEEKREPIEGGK